MSALRIPRKLVVNIEGARNLMPKDGEGSSSAFCTIDYDSNRRRTKIKPRDLNPTWGERFDFPIIQDGLLEINVYNERKDGNSRNGFLGRVRINLADVVKQGQEAIQWLRLEKRGLFSHVKGELGVKIWWEEPVVRSSPKKRAARGTQPPAGVRGNRSPSSPKKRPARGTQPPAGAKGNRRARR